MIWHNRAKLDPNSAPFMPMKMKCCESMPVSRIFPHSLDSQPNWDETRCSPADRNIGQDFISDPSGVLPRDACPILIQGTSLNGSSDGDASDMQHFGEGYSIYQLHYAPQVLDLEIQRAYMQLGEFIWARHVQSQIPAPPPPPPPIQYYSEEAQTELLSGEVDGMGRRLQMYRNHIQSLRHKVALRSSRLADVTQELYDSQNTLLRVSKERERDCEAYERHLAALRDEKVALAEKCQVQTLHLQERDKLIQHYVTEIESLEQRFKATA